MPFAIAGLAYILFAVALGFCVAGTMGNRVGETVKDGDGGFKSSDAAA